MDYRVIIIVIIVGILLISCLIIKAKKAKERSLEQERLIEKIENERLAQELKRQKEDLERKLEIRRKTEAPRNHAVRCMDICFRCRRDKCLEEMYNKERT